MHGTDYLGGIQQLRGPILIQFLPPPPLEWTSVDILHTPPCPKKALPHKIFNYIKCNVILCLLFLPITDDLAHKKTQALVFNHLLCTASSSQC